MSSGAEAGVASRPRGGAAAASAKAWWAGLGQREKRALALAGLVLLLFAVWQWALAPALQSLRTAPQRLQTLEAQNQAMRALALEVKGLRGQAAVSPAQAIEAMKAATERLGTAARLTNTGDRAVLSFTDVPSAALMAWLEEVRAGARARPIDAQMQRGPKGLSGSMSLALPGNAP